MTVQPTLPPPSVPPPSVPPRPTASSGLALGLALAALAVSLCVAAFVAIQVFFGSPMGPYGWFAYAPSTSELEMGDPSGSLIEGTVAVDASGGASGTAVAAALSESFDLGGGALRCHDVSRVVSDATSVCTQSGFPADKIVVLFLDASGRFVWTQLPVGLEGYPPRD